MRSYMLLTIRAMDLQGVNTASAFLSMWTRILVCFRSPKDLFVHAGDKFAY